MATETRTRHYWREYGRTFEGYGPSMDPHRCGHPDEPCVTITEEREVSDWVVVDTVKRGSK